MNTSTVVDAATPSAPTAPDPDAVSSGYRTYVLCALAVVGFMASIAVAHHPLGFLAQ